jgi:hypothetical protein
VFAGRAGEVPKGLAEHQEAPFSRTPAQHPHPNMIQAKYSQDLIVLQDWAARLEQIFIWRRSVEIFRYSVRTIAVMYFDLASNNGLRLFGSSKTATSASMQTADLDLVIGIVLAHLHLEPLLDSAYV